MYDIKLLNDITHNRTLHYRKDLDEVLFIAQSTPSLSKHLMALQDVIKWFDRAFKSNASINEINGYWFDFVNMVLQRYTIVFDTELAAADNLVGNLFWRFLNRPFFYNIQMSYRQNVTPLVFLGRGGAHSYYTLPPTLHRPLAIIHLPRAALNNVWRWTVLAHEIGHDVFFCVDDLARELSTLVSSTAVEALRSGVAYYGPVAAVPEINSRPVPIDMTQEQFTVLLWSRWTNELFADLFSVLMCGPSSVFTMQEVIGFNAVGIWHGVNGPDPHPLPVLRNLINLAFLRQLGFINYAEILERRMFSNSPPVRDLIWVLNGHTEVVRIELNKFMPLLELVAEAMLNYPLKSLSNHSLREVVIFNNNDQAVVESLVDIIIGGKTPPAEVEARHLTAAAQLAFIRYPHYADKIHNSVMSMLAYNNDTKANEIYRQQPIFMTL